MRNVNSLADVKPGERINFMYFNGVSPDGAMRRADVLEVDTENNRILGNDIDTNKPRWFLFNKVAMVTVTNERQSVPIAAEAACDEPATVCPPKMRTIVSSVGFQEVRSELIAKINEMNAEDLAEVAADMKGADRARFSYEDGNIQLETDVPEPKFEISCGIMVAVNSNNDHMTIHHDGNLVFANGDPVTPDELVTKLANHLVIDN